MGLLLSFSDPVDKIVDAVVSGHVVDGCVFAQVEALLRVPDQWGLTASQKVQNISEDLWVAL